MLNFLSARITGTNLRIRGDVRVNGKLIKSLDSISHMFAYVMQDDILTATMTPKGIYSARYETQLSSLFYRSSDVRG